MNGENFGFVRFPWGQELYAGMRQRAAAPGGDPPGGLLFGCGGSGGGISGAVFLQGAGKLRPSHHQGFEAFRLLQLAVRPMALGLP